MDKLLNKKTQNLPQGEINYWGKDYWKVGTELALGNKVTTFGKKSVKLLILVAIAVFVSVVMGGVVEGACVTPVDDLNIYNDTVLCDGY